MARSQIIFQSTYIELECCGRAVAGNDFPHGLARQRGDFAFQLSHTGFARVFADEFAERGVGEFQVLWCEAVLLDLARGEIRLAICNFRTRCSLAVQ